MTAGLLAGLDHVLATGFFLATDTAWGALSLVSCAVVANALAGMLLAHGGLVDEVVEARLKK